MKKITVFLLVLISVFLLILTISCQQEPEDNEPTHVIIDNKPDVVVDNFPAPVTPPPATPNNDPQNVFVVNQPAPYVPPAVKTFPAPATVSYGNGGTGKIRIIWTIVPDATNYIVYFKSLNEYRYGFIISFPYSTSTINFTNPWNNTIYVDIERSQSINFMVEPIYIGVSAISYDGTYSDIKWIAFS